MAEFKEDGEMRKSEFEQLIEQSIGPLEKSFDEALIGYQSLLVEAQKVDEYAGPLEKDFGVPVLPKRLPSMNDMPGRSDQGDEESMEHSRREVTEAQAKFQLEKVELQTLRSTLEAQKKQAESVKSRRMQLEQQLAQLKLKKEENKRVIEDTRSVAKTVAANLEPIQKTLNENEAVLEKCREEAGRFRKDAQKLLKLHRQKSHLEHQLEIMDVKIKELEKNKSRVAEKTKRIKEGEAKALQSMEAARKMHYDERRAQLSQLENKYEKFWGCINDTLSMCDRTLKVMKPEVEALQQEKQQTTEPSFMHEDGPSPLSGTQSESVPSCAPQTNSSASPLPFQDNSSPPSVYHKDPVPPVISHNELSSPADTQNREPISPPVTNHKKLSSPVTNHREPSSPITGQGDLNSPSVIFQKCLTAPPIAGQKVLCSLPVSNRHDLITPPISGQKVFTASPITVQEDHVAVPVTEEKDLTPPPVTNQRDHTALSNAEQQDLTALQVTDQRDPKASPVTGHMDLTAPLVTGQRDLFASLTTEQNDPIIPSISQFRSYPPGLQDNIMTDEEIDVDIETVDDEFINVEQIVSSHSSIPKRKPASIVEEHNDMFPSFTVEPSVELKPVIVLKPSFIAEPSVAVRSTVQMIPSVAVESSVVVESSVAAESSLAVEPVVEPSVGAEPSVFKPSVPVEPSVLDLSVPVEPSIVESSASLKPSVAVSPFVVEEPSVVESHVAREQPTTTVEPMDVEQQNTNSQPTTNGRLLEMLSESSISSLNRSVMMRMPTTIPYSVTVCEKVTFTIDPEGILCSPNSPLVFPEAHEQMKQSTMNTALLQHDGDHHPVTDALSSGCDEHPKFNIVPVKQSEEGVDVTVPSGVDEAMVPSGNSVIQEQSATATLLEHEGEHSQGTTSFAEQNQRLLPTLHREKLQLATTTEHFELPPAPDASLDGENEKGMINTLVEPCELHLPSRLKEEDSSSSMSIEDPVTRKEGPILTNQTSCSCDVEVKSSDTFFIPADKATEAQLISSSVRCATEDQQQQTPTLGVPVGELKEETGQEINSLFVTSEGNVGEMMDVMETDRLDSIQNSDETSEQTVTGDTENKKIITDVGNFVDLAQGSDITAHNCIVDLQNPQVTIRESASEVTHTLGKPDTDCVDVLAQEKTLMKDQNVTRKSYGTRSLQESVPYTDVDGEAVHTGGCRSDVGTDQPGQVHQSMPGNVSCTQSGILGPHPHLVPSDQDTGSEKRIFESENYKETVTPPTLEIAKTMSSKDATSTGIREILESSTNVDKCCIPAGTSSTSGVGVKEKMPPEAASVKKSARGESGSQRSKHTSPVKSPTFHTSRLIKKVKLTPQRKKRISSSSEARDADCLAEMSD